MFLTNRIALKVIGWLFQFDANAVHLIDLDFKFLENIPKFECNDPMSVHVRRIVTTLLASANKNVYASA